MSISAATPPPGGLTGRVLAGNYLIEHKIGDGGMGAVYAARHTRLPARLAIKVLHHAYAESDEVIRRFQHEAEITSSLRHPNIVRVTDFDRLEDGTVFLVMEYLEGEDLSARVRRQRRLPLTELLPLLRQIGGALQAAHKHGVVHRDLKPQNVFLAREDHGDGAVEVVKILDFGVSKMRRREQGEVTQAGRLLGTPQFMAPEQALGQNERVDGRTDQFALGSIVYYALSGTMPFAAAEVAGILYQVVYREPPPLQQIAPVPLEVAEVVATAMAKRPEGRHPSVIDFVKALDQAARGTVLQLAPETRMTSLPVQPTVAKPQPEDPGKTTVFVAPQDGDTEISEPPVATRVMAAEPAPATRLLGAESPPVAGLSTTLSGSMATVERPATAPVSRPRRSVAALGLCAVLAAGGGLAWRQGRRAVEVTEKAASGEDRDRGPRRVQAQAVAPAEGAAGKGRVQQLLDEGEAELEKENYVAAKKTFEAVLQEDGLEARGKVGLAKVEMRKGNYTGALRWVREAASQRPDDPGNQLLLCEVRFRLKDKSGARSACERALQLDPSMHGALELLRVLQR